MLLVMGELETERGQSSAVPVLRDAEDFDGASRCLSKTYRHLPARLLPVENTLASM